jgi:hypothetical protein
LKWLVSEPAADFGCIVRLLMLLGQRREDLPRAAGLESALRQVLEGKVYLSDAMVQTMLSRAVGGERAEVTHSPLESLANRDLSLARKRKQIEEAERALQRIDKAEPPQGETTDAAK